MRKNLNYILIFSVILCIIGSFITSCYPTKRKLALIKSNIRENKEIRCVKNDTANLHYIKFCVNSEYYREFNNIEIYELLEDLPYTKIHNYFFDKYKVEISYVEFLEFISKKSYDIIIERGQIHSQFDNIYTVVFDSITDKKMGLEYYIAWGDSCILFSRFNGFERHILWEEKFMGIKSNNSEDIYKCLIKFSY